MRHAYKFFCFALLMGVLLVSLPGCTPNAAPVTGPNNTVTSVGPSQAPLEGYPIAAEVVTTRQKTVVIDSLPSGSEKIFPYEISKYKQNGYGSWHYGPGVDSVKRTDIMPAAYNGASTAPVTRLLNFATMSDIHIVDEESPAQAIYFGYKGGTSSAYSPVILHSTQVLDAAVRTMNALNKEKPFDFVIFLGDAVNNTQYNELRWYIDVLDGQDVNPDSGAKDDPIPGPNNDYQDPYKAAGLDKNIPWYQTLGNHDHFWMGSTPVSDRIRATYPGETILDLEDPSAKDGSKSRVYMGSLDGRTVTGDIFGIGPVTDFTSPPKVLAADPNRRSLTHKEWMDEFFKTASNPPGHGFTQENVESGFACYTFEPKASVPVKVIVLDDTQSEQDSPSGGYSHGSLDQKRYDWLVSELDKGQAEGKLMIVASHVPVGLKKVGSYDTYLGWSSSAYVTDEQLVAKLHQYPNLMLWIAGHRHMNVVTALESPDADHPELGFWEVETSSLRDFPQQFRTFEILRNSDNTISIIITDVDPAVKSGSLAEQSRSYAVAAQQLFNNDLELLPSGSYNAELVKQLSPEMQAKIQSSGEAIK